MENSFYKLPLDDFTAVLASKAPVPGGGGASALAGALASALAGMVCELTSGKKKYALYEDDLRRIVQRAGELRLALLADIDADAEAFRPLSQAYAIPKDAPERGEIMENALREASRPPMRAAENCAQVIRLLWELSQKSSALAVSDVGVGVQLARAALLGAGLNVRINIKSMTDRAYAAALRERLDRLEGEALPLAEETYSRVIQRIG